jgi:hypothetical protein
MASALDGFGIGQTFIPGSQTFMGIFTLLGAPVLKISASG